MKTTVEISDTLLEEARRIAVQERTSVRALVEEGLRHVVKERSRRGDFRLRNVTFKGQGLHPDVAEASWDQIRTLVYEGRGG